MIIMSKQSKREIINAGDYTLLGSALLLSTLLVVIASPWIFNGIVAITTPLTWILPLITIGLVIFGWFRNRSFVGILAWALLSVLLTLAIFQASILNSLFADPRSFLGV